MDYLRTFAVSASGMSADRLRAEAAATNLAQANAPQDPLGTGFQPFRAVPRATQAPLPADAAAILHQVPVAWALVPQPAAPRRVQEPAHPLADAEGYVAYPGVDTALEMVSLMAAMRSYEANVAALNTARTLALKTLDIGRNA